MYEKILVALDLSSADDALIKHVSKLAEATGSELLLMHVADGFAARNYDKLKLAESEEMIADRAYLKQTAETLLAQGLAVTFRLALGDPPREILNVAEEAKCDLLALGGHGHRLIGDLIHGSTIWHVRHKGTFPILLVGPGSE
jgi:universal stress protein A